MKNIIFILIISQGVIQAQSPLYDANWELVTNKSDEFNDVSLNTALWQKLDCYTGVGFNWGGSSAFSAQNTYLQNGNLILQCDNTPNYCFINGYKTSGIQSVNEDYTYGYFEISTQLPGFIDGNGIAHADKFWPAFWTYKQVYVNNCLTVHDEIDIIDQCCNTYQDAKTTGAGYNDENGNCGNTGFWVGRTSNITLCNSYHKFAAEWNSDRILFYFDDIPYFEEYNNPAFIMQNQRALIDLQLDGPSSFYPGTPFPQYMKVDYFRYYQLKKDCGVSVVIPDYNYLNNFYFSVKSDIVFGTGTPISLSGNDRKCFRAVNFIQINGEFTVPLGGEFCLLPTICN